MIVLIGTILIYVMNDLIIMVVFTDAKKNELKNNTGFKSRFLFDWFVIFSTLFSIILKILEKFKKNDSLKISTTY
jgi:peptidoglycan biosynthesis protein MviN/MurJ (putative lipid II flippase)